MKRKLKAIKPAPKQEVVEVIKPEPTIVEPQQSKLNYGQQLHLKSQADKIMTETGHRPEPTIETRNGVQVKVYPPQQVTQKLRIMNLKFPVSNHD